MQRLLRLLFLLFASPVASACATSEPTQAVIDNDYGASDEHGNVTVYEGWWSVAAFFEPVPAGAESAPVRVVQGTAKAYLLLARDWDPTRGAPDTLVPVRTHGELRAERGDTLHIRVAPETLDGDCATGAPLSQPDADFITQRIFPDEFANVTYDATTCSSSRTSDGGGGARNEASGDAVGSGAGGQPGTRAAP